VALVFCDSFDHYDENHILNKYDSFSGDVGIVAGREGQGLGLNGAAYLSKQFSNNLSTVIVGFAIVPVLGQGAFFSFVDSEYGVAQGSFGMLGNGAIAYFSWNGTILAQSAGGVMQGGLWQYVECMVTFADLGSITLSVNGESVATVSGVQTNGGSGNSYISAVQIVSQVGFPTSFDDFYVCDNTGTVNNTFLGDIKILVAAPNGEGRVNQFAVVGGTGPNYTAVNEIPPASPAPDDDTSYVYSSTPGQIDAYALSSVGLIPYLLGVQIVASCRKDDASSRVLALGFGDGTIEAYDTGVSLGNNYHMLLYPLNENPLTSSPWAVADLDTAQIAVQVIS
jgi:hypothetical protein